jgi:2-C-methyl-D-erythritol 2,4-cyclodiphosphate synthase
MDALLGAAGLGDIGKHFPDTDPRFKDISSIILLKQVGELLGRHRISIVNIDSTVVIEAPRIAPYIDQMQHNIAETLRIEKGAVSVKATTHEGLGFIGTGSGAAAHAVAAVREQ